MDESIKVKFIGDDSGLATASQNAAKSLQQVQNATTKVSNALAQASQKMAQSAATAGGSLKTNFTGISRVIQDLPFGFIAISNNLEQLVPAAGAAGLAFSGLIAALSFAQIGLQNWTRGTSESKEALDSQVKKIHDTKQALENYVETLDDVTQARIRGTQSAQQDLVNLQTLYNATQNANIPLKERKKLVDQLQEQYPKYFANLKDEVILLGGAEKAYKDLTSAILASAKAEAAKKALVEIQSQLIALDQQYAESVANTLKAQQELKNGKGQLFETSSLGYGTSLNLTSNNAAIDAQNKLNKSKQKTVDIQKQINDLSERAKQIAGSVTNIVQANPDALTDPTGSVKEQNKKVKDVLEERKKILLEFVKDFESIKVPFPNLSKRLEDFDEKELTNELRSRLQKALLDLSNNLPTIVKDGTFSAFPDGKIPIPLKMSYQVEQDRAADEEAMRQAQDLAATRLQAIQDAVAAMATQGFVSLGEAIGTALSGGNVGNVFADFTNVLASSLESLGERMIALSPVIASLRASISSLNPALMLPAGIALVAIGASLKHIKPKGFADGGLVFGPTMGLVGEGIGTSRSNPEVIAPLNKLKDFIRPASEPQRIIVEGRVRGKDLVFVQVQELKSQRRAT